MVLETDLSHVLAITAILIIGVPLNSAVIWIFTRKDTRLGQSTFPVMFGIFDLIAIIALSMALPYQLTWHILGENAPNKTTTYWWGELINLPMVFAINGYLMTLLAATSEKYYAVMFPFEFRLKMKTIHVVGKCFSFGFNLCIVGGITLVRNLAGPRPQSIMFAGYSVFVALTFVTTIVLYVLIIVKLIRNERQLRKVGPNNANV